MLILRSWPTRVRLASVLIAAIALTALSLGSTFAHHAAGTGTDALTTGTLWLTSVTDNGDVDEDDTNAVEPPNAEDDNGDVNEDTVDPNDQGDAVVENDQGENDSSAEENDQGQDEQSGTKGTNQHAAKNHDAENQNEANDGGSGGGDQNDDSGDGEGGDD